LSLVFGPSRIYLGFVFFGPCSVSVGPWGPKIMLGVIKESNLGYERPINNVGGDQEVQVRVWEKLSPCATCHHLVRVLECKLKLRSLW